MSKIIPVVIMSNNLGSLDRMVRFLLAAALLYTGVNVYQGTPLAIGLDIGAGLLAFSATFGFCGIYRLLGINTSKSPK